MHVKCHLWCHEMALGECERELSRILWWRHHVQGYKRTNSMDIYVFFSPVSLNELNNQSMCQRSETTSPCCDMNVMYTPQNSWQSSCIPVHVISGLLIKMTLMLCLLDIWWCKDTDVHYCEAHRSVVYFRLIPYRASHPPRCLVREFCPIINIASLLTK